MVEVWGEFEVEWVSCVHLNLRLQGWNWHAWRWSPFATFISSPSGLPFSFIYSYLKFLILIRRKSRFNLKDRSLFPTWRPFFSSILSYRSSAGFIIKLLLASLKRAQQTSEGRESGLFVFSLSLQLNSVTDNSIRLVTKDSFGTWSSLCLFLRFIWGFKRQLNEGFLDK